MGKRENQSERPADIYADRVDEKISFLVLSAMFGDTAMEFVTGIRPVLTQDEMAWLAGSPRFKVSPDKIPLAHQYYLHRNSLRAGEEGLVIPELEAPVVQNGIGVVDRFWEWVGDRLFPDGLALDGGLMPSFSPVEIENP